MSVNRNVTGLAGSSIVDPSLFRGSASSPTKTDHTTDRSDASRCCLRAPTRSFTETPPRSSFAQLINTVAGELQVPSPAPAVLVTVFVPDGAQMTGCVVA